MMKRCFIINLFNGKISYNGQINYYNLPSKRILLQGKNDYSVYIIKVIK